jgi:hypothetical protein
MMRGRQQKVYLRVFCGVFGVAAVSLGGRLVVAGQYSYANWFGGLVFTPVVIIAGVLMILAAVFNWRSIWDVPPRDTKHR